MRTQNTEIATNIWSIIVIIIAIVSFAVKFTSLRDKLDYRIKTAEDKIEKLEAEFCSLQTKVNNNDVIVMEIRTKLNNIEAMLLEMRKK